MIHRCRLAPVIAICITSLGFSYSMPAAEKRDFREPLASLPTASELNPDAVALGNKLFEDPILSGKRQFACASCHNLKTNGSTAEKRPVTNNGTSHNFNTPTVFNVGNYYRFGWLGGTRTLKSQSEAVILDPNIMNISWPILLSRLTMDRRYRELFEKCFHRLPDREAVLNALVVFQQSLTTPNSPFDRYLNGESTAISSQARYGYTLFREYGCVACHQGANIGGNMFQKFGIFSDVLPEDPDNEGNLGRFMLTGLEKDRGVFRVPSLRNVAVTGPFFHDGRTESLADAVSLMAKSQLGKTLQDAERDAIVAFLESLTGEYNGKPLRR